LVRYKVPEHVAFLDALLVNAMNKVPKNELRARWTQ
jgi:acyl-CoA synthetase (AMP-forming)/AMP-acid ligase II